MSELPAQVGESVRTVCRKTKHDPDELGKAIAERVRREGFPLTVGTGSAALVAICEERGVGAVAHEVVGVRGEDVAQPSTDAPMQAEAGKILSVPIRFDLSGKAVETVTLAPETKHLIVKVEHGPRAGSNVIVSAPFDVLRFNDQRGVGWLDLSKGGDDGGPLRATIPEFIAAVRKRYALSGQLTSALGAYVNALPVAGIVSSRLELRAPTQPGETWGVPPVFAQRLYGRSDGAGLLAAWYRPRSREVALSFHKEQMAYTTTPKLRAVACYVVGAPIFHAIAPDRQIARLDLRGSSGSGKTKFAAGSVAVYWGLGGGPHEILSGEVLLSGFRRADILSATDFPVLADETHISRKEREELRAAAGGATTTRGGTDLLHRSYGMGTCLITTANTVGDESDSSLSERQADDRRRLRLTFTIADKDAIAERKEEYERFSRTLTQGETDPDGGGAALWMLRDAYAADPTLSAMREIAQSEPSEVDAILRLGALLLGIDAPRFDLTTEDDASADFLEFLRGEVVTLVSIRPGDRTIPVVSRIRAVDEMGSDVYDAAHVHAVYVSPAELAEYRRQRRTTGRDSAFAKLADLTALCSITGQNESDLIGEPESDRPARGHAKKIAGTTARVAKIVLPTAPVTPTLDREED